MLSRECDIQAYILSKIPTNMRLFRNNVGGFIQHNNLVRYGLTKGASDLIGWITVDGVARFLAIEVKTNTGTLSKEQANFLNVLNEAGGVGICIWSKAEWDFFLSNLPDIPIKTYKAGKRE